jgi:hypothetical protein
LLKHGRKALNPTKENSRRCLLFSTSIFLHNYLSLPLSLSLSLILILILSTNMACVRPCTRERGCIHAFYLLIIDLLAVNFPSHVSSVYSLSQDMFSRDSISDDLGQQDVPLDKQGLETRYPLHAAAVDGNVAKVKSLLGLGPETKGVRLFAGQLIVRESD